MHEFNLFDRASTYISVDAMDCEMDETFAVCTIFNVPIMQPKRTLGSDVQNQELRICQHRVNSSPTMRTIDTQTEEN